MTIRFSPYLLGLFFILCFSSASYAQYCTPTVTTGGIHIIRINFNNYGVTNGQAYNTTSNGYSLTSGSAGTISRYFGGSFFYSLSNPTANPRPYYLNFYADWNNDGDFADAGESFFIASGTVAGVTSLTTGYNFAPPLAIRSGYYRVRIAVSESASSTVCSSFTGEAEDYILTVAKNDAPVLNTTGNVLLNTLISTNTNSNGISITEFLASGTPASNLVSDVNDRGTGFYDLMPRGIAIYGQAATNGTWQYKVGAGAWSNFGSLSSSNALFLMADAGYALYQPATRIRFVPTGVGTPTFSYRAFDGTWGTNGTYGNIAATGDTTAFSVLTRTSAMSVVAPSGFNDKLFLSTQNNAIYTASLNKANNSISNPEPLMNNSTDYYGTDIELDAINNKIYWESGQNADKIAVANADGSGQQLSLVSGLTYSTGFAFGNNELYYWNWASDYSAADIYKCNSNGTGIVKISGGVGQFNGADSYDTKDIDFYNNKLYLQAQDVNGYYIASLNTDGTGFTKLYTLASGYFGGLDIANDTLYWTESDGSLKKRAISGGAITILRPATASRFIYDVLIDRTTSTVYYVDGDLTVGGYSLIKSIPSAGGTSTTLLTVTGAVSSLVFDKTSGILPVTLLQFTGMYDAPHQNSLLQWKTTSEFLFDHFVVERSIDGRNFEPIATVAGTGIGNSTQNYFYTDAVANISSDKLYYRLRMVDKDGKLKYSETVLLKINAEAVITRVTPNPSSGNFTLTLNSKPSKAVSIGVYSNTGQLVHSSKFTTHQYNIDITTAAAGLYYVQLQFADGSKQQLTLVKD